MVLGEAMPLSTKSRGEKRLMHTILAIQAQHSSKQCQGSWAKYLHPRCFHQQPQPRILPTRPRPGYPAEALRAIEAEIRKEGGGTRGNSSSTVVDLGCGTGKFTREFLPFARSEGEVPALARPSQPLPAILIKLVLHTFA